MSRVRVKVGTMAAMAGIAAVMLAACGNTAYKPKASNASSAGVASGYSGPSGSWNSGPYAYAPSGPSYWSGPSQPFYGTSGSSGVLCNGPSGQGYLIYGLCVRQGPSAIIGDTALNTDLGFSCRLPISNGMPASGGFISFPGGKFQADPKSDVSISYPPGTQLGMGRPSAYALSYNSHSGRWFPVGAEAVAADGSWYAVSYDESGIHVINSSGGSDTVIGKGQSWRIVAVDGSGVYANPSNKTAGLWYLPLAGPVRQVTDRGFWLTASTRVAYGLQSQSVPSGVSNPVLHLDLQSGSITTWWADPPSDVTLAAVTPQDSLIVVLHTVLPSYGSPLVDVRRMPQPEKLEGILVGLPGFVTLPLFVDARGVWLNLGAQGYPSATWFASDQGYWPVSTVSGQLGGGCN